MTGTAAGTYYLRVVSYLTALSGSPVTAHIPYRDTRQTVEKMIAIHRWCFADAKTAARLRTRVENLVRQIDGKDYASEYLAILHGAMRDVRYRRDPVPIEQIKSPDAILDEIDRHGVAQDDCETSALFIEVQCAMLGGETRFLTASFEAGPRPASWAAHPTWPWPPHTHAYMQALDPNSGVWLTLDPVAGPNTKSMLTRATQVRIYPVPGA